MRLCACIHLPTHVTSYSLFFISTCLYACGHFTSHMADPCRYERSVKQRFAKTYVLGSCVHLCNVFTNPVVRRFRTKSPAAIQFADEMLIMNPNKRPTTQALLDHTFYWSEPFPCKPEEYAGVCACVHCASQGCRVSQRSCACTCAFPSISSF